RPPSVPSCPYPTRFRSNEVEALSGRARIELPGSFAYGTAERLHRLGITPAPASELHYVTNPWVVSSERLRAAGWRTRPTGSSHKDRKSTRLNSSHVKIS